MLKYMEAEEKESSRGLCRNAEGSGEIVVQCLHKIVDLAWRSGNVPMDWLKAVIVPIHKKGSKTQCKNYRSISLLSIPGICLNPRLSAISSKVNMKGLGTRLGKAYASVLEKRIRVVNERKVLEEQGSFQKGRNCVDQLIIEKNKRMLMVCIDLQKAYDRVERGTVDSVEDIWGKWFTSESSNGTL